MLLLEDYLSTQALNIVQCSGKRSFLKVAQTRIVQGQNERNTREDTKGRFTAFEQTQSMKKARTLKVSIAASKGLIPLIEVRELEAPPDERRSSFDASATLVSEVGFMAQGIN